MSRSFKASARGVDHLVTIETTAIQTTVAQTPVVQSAAVQKKLQSNSLCAEPLLATYPRQHFATSALYTALASSLGLVISMTPTMAADTVGSNSSSSSMATLNAKSDSDKETDTLLDALRLKKAVEQGIIDRSVLDDYNQQNLSSNSNSTKNVNNAKNSSNADNGTPISEQQLQQQAEQIQQSGYQMMTPEQIENELAA